MGGHSSKLKIHVDLIAAAQNEYDFLLDVNSRPELFTRAYLENALMRYEKYWLPLAAFHKKCLPAPLDIEWIWHCHMLNPYAYEKDCMTITGVVVKHSVFSSEERKRRLEKSRLLWDNIYSDEPFIADLHILGDEPEERTPPSKVSYDVVSAALRHKVFIYNISLPHYRDLEFLSNALIRYKEMVFLKKMCPETFVVPCYDMDLIWHVHQLHPRQYRKETARYLHGKMLDHNDSPDESNLKVGCSQTLNCWNQYLKTSYAVPGALYRGKPPSLLPTPFFKYKTPDFEKTLGDNAHYIFRTTDDCSDSRGVRFDQLSEVVHHVGLAAPAAENMDQSPCDYYEHELRCNTNDVYNLQVIHCRQPAVSIIQIVNTSNDLLAMAYTIGSCSLPGPGEIHDDEKGYEHNRKCQRAILIRGRVDDWAILKVSWFRVEKNRGISAQHGIPEMKLFFLNAPESKWVRVIEVSKINFTEFAWNGLQGMATVNFESGVIQFPASVIDVGEYLCAACAISLAFILCQPRGPPPHFKGSDVTPHPLFVAAGLFSEFIPRWYHAQTYGWHGTLYQIPPEQKTPLANGLSWDFDYGAVYGIGNTVKDPVDVSEKEDWDKYCFGNFDYEFDDWRSLKALSTGGSGGWGGGGSRSGSWSGNSGGGRSCGGGCGGD